VGYLSANGSLAIVPRTRTQLTERVNHVYIPKVADSQALGLAPLGAAKFPDANAVDIYQSTASPLIGGTTGQLVLRGAGTNRGALLQQAKLSVLGLGTGTTYTASLYVNSPAGSPNPQLLVNGPGVASGNVYSTAMATKGSWYRISATFLTGNTDDAVSVYLFFDSAGFTNAYCLFDAFQIDDGAAPTVFFDGEGPLTPTPDRYYKWQGTRYNSLSAKYAFDPSEVSYPILMKNGFHAGKDNGNILHRTLSNQLVVVRRPATYSIGTHIAFFDNRLDAFNLYSRLDRLDDFQLIDNDNPETNMSFAVSGRVLIDQEPWPGKRWTVTIPYEQTA
jgi:hypothetical protein